MGNWTKGPWKRNHHANGVNFVKCDGRRNGGYIICNTVGFDEKANAQLISAAPDMAGELDNCKRMLEAIIEGYPNHDINHVDFRVQVTKWAEMTLQGVDKALSKAKGE